MFSGVDRQHVIDFHAKIPTWAEQIEFEWTDEISGIARVTTMDEKKKDRLVGFETVEETKENRFPNIARVIDTSPPKNTKRVGISAGDMSFAGKVFGSGASLLMELHGVNGNLMFTPLGRWEMYDAKLVISSRSMLDIEDEDGPVSTVGD